MKLLAVQIPDYSGISGWKLGNRPSLGGITSVFLPYVFVIAGLLMFAYLIWGGLHLILSAGDPNGIKEGTNKIVFAVIGFLIIFASYFVIQIVEIIFHISIL